MKKVYIETLGCNKNQVDSERISYLIENNCQAKIVQDPQISDIIIVNTCAFIKSAKTEAIETIFDLLKYKTEGSCQTFIVAGCLAQRYKGELLNEIPEIDIIFGVGDISQIVFTLNNNEKIIIPDYCEVTSIGRNILNYPGSAYLKISEGCSNRCAYCSIPIIRGPHRSRSVESIINEVNFLKEKNIKEITLIAQDTANFGADNNNNYNLGNLVNDIEKHLNNEDWLRILYMHPDHITVDLLNQLKDCKNFIPYFDIPFQSGSDKILKSMNRKNNSKENLKLLENIRKLFENPVIRSTFITGFPGESEVDFNDTISFVKEANLDWVGGFSYSREEDTPAFNFKNQVKSKIKKEMLNRLLEVAEEISQKNLLRFINTTQKILVEEKVENESLYIGRFWGEAPEVDGLTVLDSDTAKVGDFSQAKIIKLNGNDFFAIN